LNGAVSKTVDGRKVVRGFESLPLRCNSEFILFAGTLLVERPLARVLARVNQRQRTPALAEVHSPAIPPAGVLRAARARIELATPRCSGAGHNRPIGRKSLPRRWFACRASRTIKVANCEVACADLGTAIGQSALTSVGASSGPRASARPGATLLTRSPTRSDRTARPRVHAASQERRGRSIVPIAPGRTSTRTRLSHR
jgi:hypothetical protein